MDTTLTIRTDEALKNDAGKIFAGLGMNMTTAINMFLRQAVRTRSYPCSLDLESFENENYKDTYPEDFFSLFGSGKAIDIDIESSELSFLDDCVRESLI